MTEAEKEFKTYKRNAIKAAKELGYSDKIVKQVENGKTESEICRIMKDARAKYL